MALGAGKVKGGVELGGDSINGGVVFDEELDDRGTSRTSSEVERGRVELCRNVQGSRGKGLHEEETHDGGVTELGSPVDGRAVIVVESTDERGIDVDEVLCDGEMAEACCDVEGRCVVFVFGLDVGAAFDEESDEIEVVVLAGYMQGCFSPFIESLNETGLVDEEELDEVKLLL